MSRVLDVKYANIIGSRYDCAVIRVGHELDTEDVGAMACDNGCGEAELRCRRFGLVGMDIDTVVIRARCKQATRCGPASKIIRYDL